MYYAIILKTALFMFLFVCGACDAGGDDPSRGLKLVSVKDKQGTEVCLYEGKDSVYIGGNWDTNGRGMIAEDTLTSFAKLSSDKKAGETWKEPVTDMEFVWAPGGSFEMGDLFGDGEDDETYIRKVRLDGFWLGKYEVTVGEFRKFADETGYRTEGEKGEGIYCWARKKWKLDSSKSWRSPGYKQTESDPVVGVSWNDAQAYIKWLNGKTGRMYRLPGEAEWEYAARSGGKKYKYSWGNGNPSGNIADESLKRELGLTPVWDKYDDGYVYTSPVGRYAPNELGLYDMSGNVCEWCEDAYISDYSKVGTDNPIYSASGSLRVDRGGSWLNQPRGVRASNRDYVAPDGRNGLLGFRLARTP